MWEVIMDRNRVTWMMHVLLLGLLVCSLLAAVASAAPVRAQGPDGDGEGEGQGGGAGGEPRGQGGPTAPVGDDQGSPGPPDPEPGLLDQVDDQVNNVIRRFQLTFPVRALVDALGSSVMILLEKEYAHLKELYTDAFAKVAFGYYVAGPEKEVVEGLWRSVLTVSMFLWPLTLALNVLVIERGAMTGSITGYADLKEAITAWAASCATAGMSLVLMDWGRTLSSAIAHTIVKDEGPIASGLGRALADAALVTAVGNVVPGAGLFLLIFFLLLGFAFMIGLCLAYIARYVILYCLMVLAPFCITLGAVQPTRWVSWLWLKGLIIALLVFPFNAIMIHIVGGMADTSGPIWRLILVIGGLSVIIGVNFAVANSVFAAAGQIARMAKDTTDQIMAMAVVGAATLGLGAAALGGWRCWPGWRIARERALWPLALRSS